MTEFPPVACARVVVVEVAELDFRGWYGKLGSDDEGVDDDWVACSNCLVRDVTFPVVGATLLVASSSSRLGKRLDASKSAGVEAGAGAEVGEGEGDCAIGVGVEVEVEGVREARVEAGANESANPSSTGVRDGVRWPDPSTVYGLVLRNPGQTVSGAGDGSSCSSSGSKVPPTPVTVAEYVVEGDRVR